MAHSMSGIKRSLSTDENNDDKESIQTSENCAEVKRHRHASSHSENEEDTQLIDSENGITDGKQPEIEQNFNLLLLLIIRYRSFNKSIRH